MACLRAEQALRAVASWAGRAPEFQGSLLSARQVGTGHEGGPGQGRGSLPRTRDWTGTPGGWPGAFGGGRGVTRSPDRVGCGAGDGAGFQLLPDDRALTNPGQRGKLQGTYGDAGTEGSPLAIIIHHRVILGATRRAGGAAPSPLPGGHPHTHPVDKEVDLERSGNLPRVTGRVKDPSGSKICPAELDLVAGFMESLHYPALDLSRGPSDHNTFAGRSLKPGPHPGSGRGVSDRHGPQGHAHPGVQADLVWRQQGGSGSPRGEQEGAQGDDGLAPSHQQRAPLVLPRTVAISPWDRPRGTGQLGETEEGQGPASPTLSALPAEKRPTHRLPPLGGENAFSGSF